MTENTDDNGGNGDSARSAGRLITPEEVIEITGCTMDDLERWARRENKIPEPTPIGDTADVRDDAMEVGWLPDVVKVVKDLMKQESRRK